MRPPARVLVLLIVAFFTLIPAIHANVVTIPHTFVSGSPARAAEVNANFDTLKTAANDNYGRIEALEAALAELQTMVTALQTQSADLTAKNTTLQTSVTALQTKVADLTTQNTALQTEVADLTSSNTTLHARVSSLQTQSTDLTAQNAALQNQVDNLTGQNEDLLARVDEIGNNSVLALHDILHLTTDPNTGQETARFTGVNVQIVSGSGSTGPGVDPPGPEPPFLNGRGNLIVGYNELRHYVSNDRSGSHNIVVGRENNYSQYGGLVVGIRNTISGEWASVSGGWHNTASGQLSSVSGGMYNMASGPETSVLGGQFNTASGGRSSILGGSENTASGNFQTIP